MIRQPENSRQAPATRPVFSHPVIAVPKSSSDSLEAPASPATKARIASIDALRGLVMAAMIFVNDLAGAGRVVPDWMVHYSERHPAGASGLTFVDLVFPAFLFIVGLSLPAALGAALAQPGGMPRTLWHIGGRTASLLLVGVLMVNESPDAVRLGWPPALWSVLLYLGAFAAFSHLPAASVRRFGQVLRLAGFALLAFLLFSFVDADGRPIVTLRPLSLRHEWWGILGLIGWAYLVGALVFLAFRRAPLALLGSMALLFCLFPAERAGLFSHLWLAQHIGFGGTLGSQAAITVAGLLFATVVTAPEATRRSRVQFTALFIAGTATAAFLLGDVYGISKDDATPPWCLWACAATAALWLPLHFAADGANLRRFTQPLALAGRNVFVAYLLSNLLPPALALLRIDSLYAGLGATLPGALARAILLAVFILYASVSFNRVGFRLRL